MIRIRIMIMVTMVMIIMMNILLFGFLFTSLRDGNRPHRIVGQPLVTANDVGH